MAMCSASHNAKQDARLGQRVDSGHTSVQRSLTYGLIAALPALQLP